MMVHRLLKLIIVACSCGGLTFAQTAKQPFVDDKEVATKANEYLSALAKLNRFRGTILIAREGRVLTTSSYGFANLEDEIPNTRQTKFHLASITKTFTAMAIMMLAERGQVVLYFAVFSFRICDFA